MDAIHAIYFDALSNPFKRTRETTLSLFLFFPSPSPSLPNPTIFAVQSLFARKTIPPFLSRPPLENPLDAFLSREKDSAAEKRGKGREQDRLASPPFPIHEMKYSAFICSRWNSGDSKRDEVYPVNGGVCGGRTSLKRTNEFIFALITRKRRGEGGS